jgi:UDP-N-acetylmuramoyl-tripeptide--D-alanyl-D-alanine ligase
MNIPELYDHFRTFPEVCIDSRQAVAGSIFFAIKGPSFDGNAFAGEALDKGCSLAVVEDASKEDDPQYMVVPDALKALQQLARHHRQTLDIPILAITGSNGKTTTKELAHAMLSRAMNVVSTQGNLNNHIGLPLTLLRVTGQTDLAVVEMGANHRYEIQALCSMAMPTHGLITNIGRAHIEGFGSFGNVVRAKSELYEWLAANGGTIFRNAENQILAAIPTAGARVIEYSVTGNMFSEIGAHPYFEALWKTGGQDIHLTSHLFGSYNAENVAAAISMAMHFGVPPGEIREALAAYKPLNHRSQIIDTEKNRVVMDAYNANPSSMIPAISDFVESEHPKKVVILGDMFELGAEAPGAHREVVEFISHTPGLKAIFIGKEFLRATEGLAVHRYADLDAAMDFLQSHPIHDALVLMKGSRGMSLERLLPLL